jgi:Transposase.
MRYSYEYKRKCVELYQEGRWPETPDGIKDPGNFRDMIRRWVRMEEANGPDVLKHKGQNKEWRPEERLELVSRVLAGSSIASVAIDAGIARGLLYQWVRKYKTEGYNGLVKMKPGRASKEPQMKKLNYNNPKKLDESEYEELIRLRAENAYIKAEIEVIKKEIALREEKEAARLKAKKQRSSKNSEKTDIS